MQIAAPVYLFVAATAALTALAVACTPQPTALGDGSSKTDDSTAAKPKTSTSATSTASAVRPPAEAEPSSLSGLAFGADGGADGGSGLGASSPSTADQCVATCTATDPKAVEILATVDRCMTKCGQTEACAEACVRAVEPTCQTSPATCITINNCEASCASSAATATPPAGVAYADVAPLIAQNCGGCHNSEFSTLAQVKAARSSMLGVVASGSMPLGQPNWAQTADGQRLIAFLHSSPELQ